MSIQIKDLKAEKTYAEGEAFNYIFRVIADGSSNLLYRVWTNNKEKGLSDNYYFNKSRDKHLVIAINKQNYIREATKEEEDYLNQCIKADKYIERDEFVPSKQNTLYQIY